MLRAGGSKTLLKDTSVSSKMCVKNRSKTSVVEFSQEGGLHEEIVVEGKKPFLK